MDFKIQRLSLVNHRGSLNVDKVGRQVSEWCIMRKTQLANADFKDGNP